VTQKSLPWNLWGLAVNSRHDYNFVFMPVAAGLEEFDPLAPQREAALFYGLFLRGHSAETLRRDIDVPVKLLNKLMFRHRNEQAVRQKLQRTYLYRKQVLSIFDELVTREQAQDRMSLRIH
jgi:hypothetical protein